MEAATCPRVTTRMKALQLNDIAHGNAGFMIWPSAEEEEKKNRKAFASEALRCSEIWAFAAIEADVR